MLLIKKNLLLIAIPSLVLLTYFNRQYLFNLKTTENQIQPQELNISEIVKDSDNLAIKNQTFTQKKKGTQITIQNNNLNKKIDKYPSTKSRKKIKNKKLTDELGELEAGFFIAGRAANLSIISEIKDDELFREYLAALNESITNNPDFSDQTADYLDTFIQALENFDGNQINIEDFQCGLASCIASINSNDITSWESFLKFRRENSNAQWPLNTFVDFHLNNDDGSITHRFFFSTNNNIDAFFSPNQTQPTTDSPVEFPHQIIDKWLEKNNP